MNHKVTSYKMVLNKSPHGKSWQKIDLKHERSTSTENKEEVFISFINFLLFPSIYLNPSFSKFFHYNFLESFLIDSNKKLNFFFK